MVDSGYARSAAMRLLKQQRPDVGVYLFDISNRYVDFQEESLSAGQWATHIIPPAW